MTIIHRRAFFFGVDRTACDSVRVRKAHMDFPLALNDETGVWTLRVSEPLTGVAAEQTFTVKE